MADHYVVLQVQPTAHPDVIAAAHRALARRHHPDMGGDERAMMLLNASWEVLRDPARRAAYDVARLFASAAPLGRAGTAAPAVAEQARQPVSSPGPAPAKPPRQQADTAILDFGRYEGRSVVELARTDPDYLLWLVRTPIGRRYGREVSAILDPPKVTPGRTARRGALAGARR